MKQMIDGSYSHKIGVPWAFKSWPEVHEDLFADIKNHMLKLSEHERDEYRLYLTTHCGFPNQFFYGWMA